MATKVYCDVCGKEIAPKLSGTCVTVDSWFNPFNKPPADENLANGDYDLCLSCASILSKFLKGDADL